MHQSRDHNAAVYIPYSVRVGMCEIVMLRPDEIHVSVESPRAEGRREQKEER